jgi:hypothetical protein
MPIIRKLIVEHPCYDVEPLMERKRLPQYMGGVPAQALRLLHVVPQQFFIVGVHGIF